MISISTQPPDPSSSPSAPSTSPPPRSVSSPPSGAPVFFFTGRQKMGMLQPTPCCAIWSLRDIFVCCCTSFVLCALCRVLCVWPSPSVPVPPPAPSNDNNDRSSSRLHCRGSETTLFVVFFAIGTPLNASRGQVAFHALVGFTVASVIVANRMALGRWVVPTQRQVTHVIPLLTPVIVTSYTSDVVDFAITNQNLVYPRHSFPHPSGSRGSQFPRTNFFFMDMDHRETPQR